MLQSLIIGFGKAGRDLHLHCLRKLQSDPRYSKLTAARIGVVDPRIADLYSGRDQQTVGFSDLAMAVREGFDPATTVVHICTAPEDHLAALRQAAEHGYKMILVEKPLTTTVAQLAKIYQLQTLYNLDLLVVANWLSSTLTARIKHILNLGQFGDLRSLSIEQHKTRFARTLSNPGHTTVFDVEVPHQMALALYLGGTDAEVTHAYAGDMRVQQIIIPYMGMVQIGLHHMNGVRSTIHSDLTTHVRKRSIELQFDTHRVVGHYPTSGDESYSRLAIYDRHGTLLESELMEDDPLTSCFVDYYRYYRGAGVQVASTLAFNAAVISSIHRAKTMCGVAAPAEETTISAATLLRGHNPQWATHNQKQLQTVE